MSEHIKYSDDWQMNDSVKMYRDFGPCIMEANISDELYHILWSNALELREQKRPETDHRKFLAGNIAEEYAYINQFSKEEDKRVENELTWFAREYSHRATNQYGLKKPHDIKTFEDITLVKPVWVNFQKKHEWNPPHTHTGALSCVIYLKAPYDINMENGVNESNKHSNTPSAGKISLSYGQALPYSSNSVLHTPKEKKILMYPAWLEHQVFPFQSDVERVSVSCNFIGRNSIYWRDDPKYREGN